MGWFRGVSGFWFGWGGGVEWLVGWLVGWGGGGGIGFSVVFGLLASGFHGLRVAQRIEHNSRIASSTVHEP